MTNVRGAAVARGLGTDVEPPAVVLRVRWPWWSHPIWALVLLTASTASIALVLPPSAYAVWGVPKYLEDDPARLLVLGIASLVVGLAIASGRVAARGRGTIEMSENQIRFLGRAFRTLFVLTLAGYVAWCAVAALRGAGPELVFGVLRREEGALGALKTTATPVGGVTTLTQFGPLAAALGYLLKRAGVGGNGYLWLVALAAARAVLYAERLALIEVVLPVLLLACIVERPRNRVLTFLTSSGPVVAVPTAWAMFATFEYMRSWVSVESEVSQGYLSWVSSRMLGYYTTAYNNSALLYELIEGSGRFPYFIAGAVWNAPVVENAVARPRIDGLAPEVWWEWALATHAAPALTSRGSFLVTNAELGTLGMVAYWLLAGLATGALFARARRGGVPAVLAYAAIFIALLELPRLIYWGEGRAVPLLIGAAVLALRYPVGGAAPRGGAA